LSIALILFVLLAIYGSWVPFHVVSVDLATAMRRFFEILSRPLTFRSRSDWASNVLLFVPIGFFAMGLVRGSKPAKGWRFVTVPSVFLGCMLLSLFIEFGQLWLADRTCSQNDMVAESIGGLCGAVAWIWLGGRFVVWLDRLHRVARPRA